MKKMLISSFILILMCTTTYAARNYEKLCGGYEKACENGKCGLFTNGHQDKMIYNDIKCIGNRIIVVSTTPKKWSIYNEQTGIAGNAQYDEIKEFDTFLVKIKANNKWGLASEGSAELLPAKYEDIAVLSNDYIMAKSNGKWQLFHIGKDIEKVSKDAYDSIKPVTKYHKGYYLVTVNNKKGVIYLPTVWQADKVNLSYVKPMFDDIVLPPTYDMVKVSKNKQWAFYDLASGELVTSFYDDIERLNKFDPMFKTTLKGLKGILERDSKTATMKEILKPSFEDVKSLVGKQFIAVSAKGKWGVYDITQNKLVLEPVYEDIRSSGAHAVQVQEQGKWVKKSL